MIELKQVTYAYEGRVALNEINLQIQAGESVAIMGANGSGKSTLLKLINGIIAPTQGFYKFDGDLITHERLQEPLFAKAFHQRIGFVFQNAETQLFCANVYDEVAFGPRQMGLSEAEVERRVTDALGLLSIGDFKQRVPYHLSGGEKRKVAMASVLALNPDVLILDEPMNGLDPKSQRWLVSFLRELSAVGKTLIISTHNMELVNELAKRAILFDESHRIVGDMDTAQLLDNVALLKQVNLVDECYHVHDSHGHKHYHDHR